jgi:hypothetical protein
VFHLSQGRLFASPFLFLMARARRCFLAPGFIVSLSLASFLTIWLRFHVYVCLDWLGTPLILYEKKAGAPTGQEERRAKETRREGGGRQGPKNKKSARKSHSRCRARGARALT